jgi:hypothetical protein
MKTTIRKTLLRNNGEPILVILSTLWFKMIDIFIGPLHTSGT